jgi:hypothetical protein
VQVLLEIKQARRHPQKPRQTTLTVELIARAAKLNDDVYTTKGMGNLMRHAFCYAVG